MCLDLKMHTNIKPYLANITIYKQTCQVGYAFLDAGTCICRDTYHVSLVICDWASENGPSGHTKFDHIFQICLFITNNLL